MAWVTIFLVVFAIASMIFVVVLQTREERRGVPDGDKRQRAAARLRPIMGYSPVLRFLDVNQINLILMSTLCLPAITGWKAIPMWISPGITVVFVILGLVWFVRTRRRVSRFFDGLARQEFLICPDCHYALVAHAQGGRCPECGYAFTPETLQADWADVKVLARPLPASKFRLFSWPRNGAPVKQTARHDRTRCANPEREIGSRGHDVLATRRQLNPCQSGSMPTAS